MEVSSFLATRSTSSRWIPLVNDDRITLLSKINVSMVTFISSGERSPQFPGSKPNSAWSRTLITSFLQILLDRLAQVSTHKTCFHWPRTGLFHRRYWASRTATVRMRTSDQPGATGKSRQKTFELPPRPFYRRCGPPFLKSYKFKFFYDASLHGRVAGSCIIFTSVETNKS